MQNNQSRQTNFDKYFKNATVDSMVDVLRTLSIDDAPWERWFNKHYCSKCEDCMCTVERMGNKKLPVAYCELYDKCRFFPDANILNGVSDFIIKIWLNANAEELEGE